MRRDVGAQGRRPCPRWHSRQPEVARSTRGGRTPTPGDRDRLGRLRRRSSPTSSAALLGARPGAAGCRACVAGARAVVLLVLDGLGWRRLEAARARGCPSSAAMEGGPITTVVPSTTAAALTSIATGLAPARHGIIGYRMRVGGQVLDVLQLDGRPRAGPRPEPRDRRRPAFGGRRVPVVTGPSSPAAGSPRPTCRAPRFVGWRTTVHPRRPRRAAWSTPASASSTPTTTASTRSPTSTASSDGFFPAELAAADRLVGDLLDALPADAAVVVTADHGQVHFDDGGSSSATCGAPVRHLRRRRPLPLPLRARAGGRGAARRSPASASATWPGCSPATQLVDEGWLGPVAGGAGRVPPAGRRRRCWPAGRRSPSSTPPTSLEKSLLAGHGSLTVRRDAGAAAGWPARRGNVIGLSELISGRRGGPWAPGPPGPDPMRSGQPCGVGVVASMGPDRGARLRRRVRAQARWPACWPCTGRVYWSGARAALEGLTVWPARAASAGAEGGVERRPPRASGSQPVSSAGSRPPARRRVV